MKDKKSNFNRLPALNSLTPPVLIICLAALLLLLLPLQRVEGSKTQKSTGLRNSTLILDDATVYEGDGTATINGHLSLAPQATSLTVTLNNGATITFNVGQTSTTSTEFAVRRDDPYNNPEYYTLSVVSTDGGGNFDNLYTYDDSDIQVLDTIDKTTLTVEGQSPVLEGTTVEHTFTVNETTMTGLSIEFEILNGTTNSSDFSGPDFPGELHSVEILAGEVSASFYLTTVVDGHDEGTENYFIRIVSCSGGNGFEDLDIDDSPIETEITDTAPEIDVQRPASSSIVNGGTDNIGTQAPGSVELVYTIDNTAGTATLYIPADSVTAANQNNCSGFAVATALPLNVAKGDTADLRVSFTVNSPGTFSWDMSIGSNDSDETPYTFTIEGTGEASLPVELSLFSAEPVYGGVLVSWTTESETDNLGFVLERAPGAEDYQPRQWEVIASGQIHPELSGQGNSSERHDYTFIDTDITPGQTYSYRLSDVNLSGEVHVYDVISIDLPDAHEETVLDPPFPNPFNPETKINYQLAESGQVEITIYDMLGRKVKTLIDKQQTAGSYNIYWHGRDESGNQTSTGTYLIVLRTVNGVRTQKVVMMR
ncbi:T9SS type A sorting domain-containing protein [bacterium]|nr:T9SS type A sorting domain-containing protein [bacterium]